MIVVGKDKAGSESKHLKLEYMETIPHIFLLDGRIYNSKVFWLPSQKMLFQSLIL